MRDEKKAMYNECVDRLKKADSIIITRYIGLNADNMNALRSLLYKRNSRVMVVKNRIFKLATKEALPEVEIEQFLNEPTAIIFIEDDPISVSKAVVEFGRGYKHLHVQGGFIENRMFSSKEMLQLAKLPSKEMLIAQVVSGIGAPLSRLVFVLSGIVGGLVNVLNAVIEKKKE